MSIERMLTSKQAIKENIDPTGKQWGVAPLKGTALCVIGIVNAEEERIEIPANLPKPFVGKFTAPSKAQDAIRKFLSREWRKNDEAAKKAATKRVTNASEES